MKNMDFSVYAFGVLMTATSRLASYASGRFEPVRSGQHCQNNHERNSSEDGAVHLAGIICLLLLTYIPQIITVLPTLMGLK